MVARNKEWRGVGKKEKPSLEFVRLQVEVEGVEEGVRQAFRGWKVLGRNAIRPCGLVRGFAR
jgi:hypothetical protein